VRLALPTSLLLVRAVAAPSLAWAQAAPVAPAPAAGTTTTTTSTSSYGAAAAMTFGSPQSANGTIGGGNATESSSHPVTGDEEDNFDYAKGGGAGGAAHGDQNGPIFISGTSSPTLGQAGEAPSTYLVKRGDTLWAIGDRFFQNPYLWPRLWSYNPQIKNPHWINPGDELRLKEGPEGAAGVGAGGGGGSDASSKPLPVDANRASIVDRRRQVPSDTVFLRDEGWVHDDTDQVWGDISGAPRDKMFLSDLDEVYVAMRPGHDVKLGQELTIFRPEKTAASGAIVQILGTARVDQYDPHERVARARIVETLDVIERGSDVGPLERRFQIVPPRRNEAEVQAHVLATKAQGSSRATASSSCGEGTRGARAS
jgi:LysM repeat protein